MSVDTLLSSLPAYTRVIFDLAADDLNGNGDGNAGFSDAGSVSTWKDRSGNARDFAAGAAPIVKTAITPTGKPVVRFNGSSQYLTRAYEAAMNPTADTCFVVFSTGLAFIQGLFCAQDSSTSNGWRLLLDTTGSRIRLFSQFGSAYSDNLTTGDFYVGHTFITGQMQQVDCSVSTTVGNVAPATYTPNGAAAQLIGKDIDPNFFQGDLARLIRISGRVSESLRSRIEHQLYRDYVAASTSTDAGAHTSTIVATNGQDITITFAAPTTAWAVPFAVDVNQITLTMTRPKPDGTTGTTVLNGDDDLRLISALLSSGSLVVKLRPRRTFIRSNDTLTVDYAAGFIADGPGSGNATVSAGSVTNNSTIAYPKAVGNWGTTNYDTKAAAFDVEVDADSIEDIARVEVYIGGTLAGSATTRTVKAEASGRNCDYFAVSVDPTDYADGAITVDFKAIPVWGTSDSVRDTSSAGLGDAPGSLTLYANSGGTLAEPAYYVDSVSGSDTTGTGATAAPWASLDKAIAFVQDNAKDGASINLRGTAVTYTRTTDETTTALSNTRYVVIQPDIGASEITVAPAGKDHTIRRLKLRGVALGYGVRIIRGPRAIDPATVIADSKLVLENCEVSSDWDGTTGTRYDGQIFSDTLTDDSGRYWDQGPDIVGCHFHNVYAGPVVGNCNLVRDCRINVTSPNGLGLCRAYMACLVTDNELKAGSGDHTDGIVLHDGITNDNITCSNLSVLNVRGQGLFAAGDSMSNVVVRNLELVGITNIQYESGIPTNADTLTIEHMVLRNLTIANQDLALNTKHIYTNCAILDSATHYFGFDDGILADELHAWGGTSGGDNADLRQSFGDPGFTDGAYDADYDSGSVDYSPAVGSVLNARTAYPAGTFDLDGFRRSTSAGAIGAIALDAEGAPAALTADAGTDQTITDTEATLDGSASGGTSPYAYAWEATTKPTGASEITATGATPTITFDMAGDYVLTLTVTDNDGTANTDTVAITVSQTVTSLVVSPASANVAVSGTRQFSATVLDQFGDAITGETITWTNSGGGSVDSSGLYTAPAATGSDVVTATDGAVSDDAAVTVVVAGGSVVGASPALTELFTYSF